MSAGRRVVDDLNDYPGVRFGRFVRQRRVALGLRQEDIAEAIGEDQTYISGVEQGRYKRLPTPEIVVFWCAALGVLPEEALGATGYLGAREHVTAPADVVFANLVREVEDADALSEVVKESLRRAIIYARSIQGIGDSLTDE